MAHPSDPRHAAAPIASGFVNARLTPEEAERLAATFRPSWQVDEPPMAASDANFQAGPGGSGAQPDQRTAVQALNGNYPPAPATVRDELDRSVIIDPAIAPPVAAPAPAQTRTVVMPAAMGGVDPRMRGLGAAGVRTGPPAARRSVDFGEAEFPKRSKTGLWVGLAAALAAVVGIGIWMLSGSDEKAAPPAPSVQKVQPAETPAAAAPPRPTETPTAAVAPPPPIPQAPPPAPLPIPTAAATPNGAAGAPAAPPVAAAPVAPRMVVPPAPRPPTWTPPVARPPAPRPKPAGTTIVRDVPF